MIKLVDEISFVEVFRWISIGLFIFVTVSIIGAIGFLPSTSHKILVVVAGCITLLVTTLAFWATFLSVRTSVMKEIYNLLSSDDPMKKLLFNNNPDQYVQGNDESKGVWQVAIRLDRAAALARKTGTRNKLLERYWDWYFHLFVKYGNILDAIRAKKRDAVKKVFMLPQRTLHCKVNVSRGCGFII